MAEFVERRIEEIIPEVEEMERMGLLAPKEIKKLIVKRKEYEYRIARRTKNKMDFINYVEYEKKLLELLKIRRKKMNCTEKRGKIEGAIARRTIKQLRYMSRIWHEDLDVWARRVEFAKSRQWNEEVSVAYTEQLRFHSQLEWLWVALARWEVEGRKNFDRARRVLLSMAPLYHPKSIPIRRELFRLELLYLESLRIKMENDNIAGHEELNNENKDKVLECGVARIIYQDSVEQIPQPELYLQFYRVAHNFEFAHMLRDEVYRDLCKAFPNDDSVWKLLAQRAALGLPEQIEIKDVNSEETPSKLEERSVNLENIEAVNESTENVKHEETKDHDDDEEDEDDDEDEESESDEESADSESKDSQKTNKVVSSSSEEESDEEEEEQEEEVDKESESDKESADSESDDLQKTNKVVSSLEEESDEEGEEQEGEGDNDSESDKESADSEFKDLQKPNKVSSSVDESDEEEEQEEKGDTMEESEEDDATVNNEEEIKQDDDLDEGYNEDIPVMNEASANTPKTAPQKTLETLFSTFEKAMEKTSGDFANSYVTELLPLLYQCWGIDLLRNMIFKKINNIYKENTKKLSPHNYFVVSSVLSAQGSSLEDQRRVLECALKQHPGHKQLQLELLKIVARDAYTDDDIKTVFDSIRKSLSGQWLVSAWDIAMKNLTNSEVLTQLFDEAHKSHNTKVSKAMRRRHLQWKYQNAGIVGCRKLYNKIQGVPPFNAAAHSTMLQLELQQKTVAVDEVRRVLNNAVSHFGDTHPGVWLSYIYFEKTKGDPVKVSGLYTRAERTLNAAAAHTFRQINIAIRETLNKNTEVTTKTEDEEVNENTVVVVGTESVLGGLNSSTSQQDEEEEERRLNAAAVINIVAEEVIMGYTQHRERATFFNNLRCIRESLNTDSEAPTEEEESVWEAPLNSLVGNKVSLILRKVEISKEQQIKDDPIRKIKKNSGMITPRFMKSYELSDQLQVGEEEVLASTDVTQDINKILKESETLQPGFMNRRRVKPYAVSKKKAKAIRKRQREKTAGPGWHNMRAPEITPEVKRDLEILQMRGVLNPKRHYKNSDMKVLPKFFQMGTVVDNPLEFYTSRVTKKERKKNLADEIIHDEEVLRYQKRKYNEIIANRQKKEFRHKSHSKKGKNYSGEKPSKKRKMTT